MRTVRDGGLTRKGTRGCLAFISQMTNAGMQHTPITSIAMMWPAFHCSLAEPAMVNGTRMRAKTMKRIEGTATRRSRRRVHTSDKQNDPDDIKLPEDGNSELLESWSTAKLTKKDQWDD